MCSLPRYNRVVFLERNSLISFDLCAILKTTKKVINLTRISRLVHLTKGLLSGDINRYCFFGL